MDPVSNHEHAPDVRFDGGDMDCGSGLLLLIRKHMDPLDRGGLLEIQSTDSSVQEDLPAWCRLTGNALVSWTRNGRQRSYLVCKGPFQERKSNPSPALEADTDIQTLKPTLIPVQPLAPLPEPAPAPAIPPLSVMGVGSWPRPRWMVRAMHEHMEGRMGEGEFQATADDAVRLCVQAQVRAGVDVITDGEQRRDSYANFVGGRLDNCQLIPLTDLLPLVDDPQAFEEELQSLDVPAEDVRHPALFGPLGRSRPLAGHELAFTQTLNETSHPIKVALPGPYLLTRIMWMECLEERVYDTREQLAVDVVRVLREELFSLLSQGAGLVQFDEPVLTEVVFTGPKNKQSFMCGALSEKGDAQTELEFARALINQVVEGAPPERTAVHVCRGNWTPDESAALSGDYRPLLELLKNLKVGTLFLELCTPRAGEMEVLSELPEHFRIGVGVVNPKNAKVESVDEILAKAQRAVRLFGKDRILLNPDCGFATFADNPVSSAAAAEQKLAAMVEVSRRLRVG